MGAKPSKTERELIIDSLVNLRNYVDMTIDRLLKENNKRSKAFKLFVGGTFVYSIVIGDERWIEEYPERVRYHQDIQYEIAPNIDHAELPQYGIGTVITNSTA